MEPMPVKEELPSAFRRLVPWITAAAFASVALFLIGLLGQKDSQYEALLKESQALSEKQTSLLASQMQRALESAKRESDQEMRLLEECKRDRERLSAENER